MAEQIEEVTGAIDAQRMQGWSFADFIRGKADAFEPAARNLASGFVEGFQAASPRRMSAAAIEGETLEDEEQFLLPAGYDRVVAALSGELPRKRVNVVCDAAVMRVEWKRGAVRVWAGRRVYGAAAAVLTLPLGVWRAAPGQRGAVRFEPPLRAKRKIAAAMGVGHVIRVQLRFDARAWRGLLPEMLRRAGRGGFGFIHSRMEGVPVWWALSSRPVLTGWAGGPAAKVLIDRSRSAVFEQALGSLARMLGVSKRALRGKVADWQTHNWSRDPFSRCAYSFIAAGAEGAAEKFRAPVQDTLFFAGEATADGEEAGTVHGAHASGLRAADEVKRAAAK